MTDFKLMVAQQSGKGPIQKWSNGGKKGEMDLFWCISMTNNVNLYKKSMEGSKLSDLVFLQWEVTDWQELFVKNVENKGN